VAAGEGSGGCGGAETESRETREEDLGLKWRFLVYVYGRPGVAPLGLGLESVESAQYCLQR
jgi:hypothetical protein